jgi:hypothetical protein
MNHRFARSALTRSAWVLVCALVFGRVSAQAERDPTVAPPQAATAPAAGPGQATAQSLPAAAQGLSVVIRDGAPYLVSDTRLYGVGQALGSYTIERITETEVWLRRGNQIQKFQRFSGIQRRVAQP